VKRIAVLILIAAALIARPPAARAAELTPESLSELGDYYRYFAVLPVRDDAPLRYIYGDYFSLLRVFSVEDGRSVLEWETNLGSNVRALLLRKIDEADTRIIVATERGRVFSYDAFTYDLVTDNLMEPFEIILCFEIANLDDDPQGEAVIVGTRNNESGSHLFIFDTSSRELQWASPDPYAATEMLIANVDDDDQLEIILNTGIIIDPRFRSVETYSSADGSFGIRLKLLDVNGDGTPEIIGEGAGRALSIYDPYARRKLY